MKAVVMAGGEGSRLRPLTIGRPKPLVQLVNKPVLAHMLDLLKTHGIREVVITVQYLANLIQAYFGDGSSFGISIHYSIEEVPLGTAGSVRQAARHLDDETFLVLSGDAITDIDLSQVIEAHRKSQAVATITLSRVQNPLEYGLTLVDEQGRITQFLEKPGWSDVVSDTVNTGIYVLEPEVLDAVEEGEVCDFSHDLFPLLLEEEAPLYGFVADGYWTDIGTVDEYFRATADMLSGRVRLKPLGERIGGDIICAGDRDISPDARLYGPIFLGNGATIKAGAVVRGPTVLGDNVVVDTRSKVERAIIGGNSYVGDRAEIRGALIGRTCSIKSRAMIFEGVVVGDNTLIQENAVIQANVKIWPSKEVEAGATVTTSIIWGSQGKRTLFGRYGVTGLVNVDLTSEFAARLGGAYASTLPKRANVAVNREAHNTPRVLKRAVLSGLPGAGVHALDTGTQPIPVARYYTRDSEVAGGIHVRLSPYNNRVVDIKFFDGSGLDLDRRAQRNVETVFFREDFRRAYLEEIGRIEYPVDVVSRYQHCFLGALDRGRVSGAAPYNQIVVDYANAVPTLVLPDLLRELGTDEVSVNSRLDETKLFQTRDGFKEAMSRLSSMTQALGSNFGARLDAGGERVFLTSADGRVIPDMDALAAVAELVLQVYPGAAIGVPVTAPRLFESLAMKYGGEVRRLRVSSQAHMEAALDGSITMIGDGRGGFIFPIVTPFPDGMFAIAKLMQLTAQAGRLFSEAVCSVPTYHVERGQIACSQENKGRVMRLLGQRYWDAALHSVDGVSIELDKEWVLILPDPDEPLIHVYAEGLTAEAALTLVDDYASVVRDLLDAA
ncbi:MAG TPA: sugar phosphate nucleotidyltransferase [Ardenticatenaceae bacterium]|nr:sugar phosphate nucleotidyltransferase [Ardenticatenaceae bacterium]